ncbi:MAG: lysine-sensitive aspartokinase 3 [Acidobacteriota bacterium]|nr:lysine-sensitive aspartokinase 3 [Acidobacteriota bacterium]
MAHRPTIMKFGGTSVEDAAAFERVARVINSHQSARPVVVVSAISGMTDALLNAVRMAAGGTSEEAAHTLEASWTRHLTVAESLLSAGHKDTVDAAVDVARREIPALLASVATHAMPQRVLQDVVVAYGERLSATVLAAVLRERGLPAQYVDTRRCIITDAGHGSATPLFEETNTCTRREIEPLLQSSKIPVLGGFIAATADGATTTLGRGGSDYSAAIIGTALGAREIQIWTDVTGVLTADPRVVPEARTVARLSYDEAAELAYFGAKVLHPKTIQPAVERNIPVRICNSRAPDEFGTLVDAVNEATPRTVKSIAHKTGVTILRITSARMLGAYGFLRALFEVFERQRTVVDVVTTSEVSVSLSLEDTNALPSILHELREIGTVEIEPNRAIICVVGEGIRGTPGIAGEVFNSISDINVSLISLGASSINLTFVVAEDRAQEVVRRLHHTFFEREEHQRTHNTTHGS